MLLASKIDGRKDGSRQTTLIINNMGRTGKVEHEPHNSWKRKYIDARVRPGGGPMARGVRFQRAM